MALTEQEKQIVEYGKANGKSQAEVITALNKFRAEQAQKGDGDYPGKGVVDQLKTGGERIAGQLGDIADNPPKKLSEIPELELKTARAVGTTALESLKTAGSVLAEPFRVAYHALPKSVKDGIGKTAEEAFQNVISAAPDSVKEHAVQAIDFLQKNPEYGQIAQDTVDLLINATALSGFEPKDIPVLDRHITVAQEEADALIPKGKTVGENGATLGGILEQAKQNILLSFKEQKIPTAGIEKLDPTKFTTVAAFADAAKNAIPGPYVRAAAGLSRPFVEGGSKALGEASKALKPVGGKLFSTFKRAQDQLAPADKEAGIRALTDSYKESFVENNASVNSTLGKLARKESTKDAPLTGDDLIKELAQEGYMPGVNGKLANMTPVLDDIANRQAQIADGIDTVLKNYGDVKTPLSVLENRAKQTLRDSPQIDADLNKSLDDISRMFDSFREKYGDQLDPIQVNQIRKNMNRRTKAFNTELFTQDSSDAVADAARTTLDDIVPNGAVREANAEIGRLFRLEKTARVFDNKPINVGVVGGQLGRYLGVIGAGGVGLATGGPGGLVVAGIAAHYGSDGLAQVIRSMRFNDKIRQAILTGLRENPEVLNKLLLEAKQADAEYLLREVRKAPLALPAPKEGAPRSKIESGPVIRVPKDRDTNQRTNFPENP